MDAEIVKAKGKKVRNGRYAGEIWQYDGRLWLIFKKDTFAYLYGTV